MNPTITFPPSGPALKLERTAPSAEKWAATLAEERRRLQEDQDALREREQNLRDYELRLRSLQAEIEAGRAGENRGFTAAPMPQAEVRSPRRDTFEEDTALQAGWEKLHRARELFAAEQNNLRDDRIAVREQEAALRRREVAVSERESRLAAREALVAAAAPAEPMAGEHTMSAVTRLTRAPFNMARSVFGAKKA